MPDEPLQISVSYPMDGLLNANGRVYPPELFKEAMEKAAREGKLKVDIGGTQEPWLKGKPITLGNKRFVDPKMQIESMDMGPDGELQAVIRVEEQAGAVDQLAAVARDDEDALERRLDDGLGSSSKSTKSSDGDGQTR